jgi:hypothetical protein
MADADGIVSYSAIKKVDFTNNTNAFNFSLYPNPLRILFSLTAVPIPEKFISSYSTTMGNPFGKPMRIL